MTSIMKKNFYVVMALLTCAITLVQCGQKPSSAENATENIAENTAENAVEYDMENASAEEPLSFTVNGVTFNMILVKGGTFTMGATKEQGEDAKEDEKPAHEVTISDYYIGETEVTQALYEAVMGENPSDKVGADLPVESLDGGDCDFFAEKLSKLTGRKFRLPTEAEWEYAARGGNKSKGYKYSGSDNVAEVAWFNDMKSGTHPVKGKAPNELGIYDMSGNVDEYCADDYAPYSKESQTNPKVENEESEGQIVRGGNFCEDSAECMRVSARSSTRGYVFGSLGFRIALSF